MFRRKKILQYIDLRAGFIQPSAPYWPGIHAPEWRWRKNTQNASFFGINSKKFVQKGKEWLSLSCQGRNLKLGKIRLKRGFLALLRERREWSITFRKRWRKEQAAEKRAAAACFLLIIDYAVFPEIKNTARLSLIIRVNLRTLFLLFVVPIGTLVRGWW